MLQRVATAMRFDESYKERAQLLDGAWVTLRLIRPSDKDMVKRGFERLTPESRYRRFMGTKKYLSEKELEFLTKVDGTNHVAIIAAHESEDGTTEGVGIARFVRLTDGGHVAEAAVTVLDAWQNRRLGTLLLDRLAAAALERNVSHFRAVALPDNPAIRGLLKELGPAVTIRNDGDQIAVDVALERVREREHQVAPDALRRMLKLVAQSGSAPSVR